MKCLMMKRLDLTLCGTSSAVDVHSSVYLSNGCHVIVNLEPKVRATAEELALISPRDVCECSFSAILIPHNSIHSDSCSVQYILKVAMVETYLLRGKCNETNKRKENNRKEIKRGMVITGKDVERY